ncbi:branched-chain amino acid ABC transporter ATP-binding protein/permease [Variovorax sp. GT1P44]|uniref:branched-chain amino acid ABC transporter ATP-binding protein/permease n=1 Tax=Variovorax sp. GT1P44 TaxID=3443742 RepID=UPI003F45E86D
MNVSTRTLPTATAGAEAAASRSAPGRIAIAAAVVAALSVPLWFRGDFILFMATQAGVMMLVAIGLNFLTGYAGQVSLGAGALVAVGSYTTALLMVDAHWSFWASALAGMVLATVIGLVMALPALRLSTWYFALVTLTFAQVVTDLLVEWRSLTRGFSGIVGIPAPAIAGYTLGPVQVYLVVAGCVVAAFLVIRNLTLSRYGRGMVAARDNPLAATASGVSLLRIKLFAFAVSAALSGLAGAFYAVQKTVITPEDFTADFSIFFLLMIVTGGLGKLWGPVIGTLIFFLLPELLGALQSWRLLIYGVMLLVLMIFAPHGIMGMGFWKRWGARGGASRYAGGDVAGAHPVHRLGLVVRDLHKQFGGVAALQGCALSAKAGSTHALVGPNGSGKTTTLNVISGFIRSDQGSVLIGDVDVSRRAPHEIARLGVGRTFQTPKLLPDMTVLDNVRLGGFPSEHATAVEIALGLPRARRDRHDGSAAAMALLRFVGLGERADDLAGDLPHGQQRLVEIARAMAGHPSLLLLDEPAAGLSMDELDRLGALIEAITRLGTTVLIVEHHLELIARISRSVTVLDRGKVLAAGTPDEVFSHPEVERAYMGREGTGGSR